MMRKRGRREDWNPGRLPGSAQSQSQSQSAAASAPLFNLDELHERRILSWSPELEDELGLEDAEPASAEPDPPPPVAPVAPEPPKMVAQPAPPKPAAPTPTPVAQDEVAAEKRGRGRPRGRPRRQVHFHVDPDEEVLLMAAVQKFGSQQKGLIGALQALQDVDVVRDEVERLAAECERQRKLLEQAESIFGR
jgi:outer membrane biosynthesis protein TonB